MKQWLIRLNPLRIQGSAPGAGDVAVQHWVTIALVIMRAYEFYVTILPVWVELGQVRLAGADTGVENTSLQYWGTNKALFSAGCSIFNITRAVFAYSVKDLQHFERLLFSPALAQLLLCTHWRLDCEILINDVLRLGFF